MASAPLPRRPPPEAPSDPDVAHALVGAARAVHRLAAVWREEGAVSALVDEAVTPLSAGSLEPERPIEWVWSLADVPPQSVILEHLHLLTETLGCEVLEIVTAVLLLDRLTRVRPTWVQVRALRMTTIVAFILAMKSVNEWILYTSECCEALAENFPNLSTARVGALEVAFMRLLDFRIPCGMEYTIYCEAIFDLANETEEATREAPQIQF